MLRHHHKKHPKDDNLHQSLKPTEEQFNRTTPVMSTSREPSYKDSGYSVFRLGEYGGLNCRNRDRVGPIRNVRSHVRQRHADV